MGLKCRISYLNGEAKVFNENGTESQLYKDLLEFTENQDKALNLWALTESDNFSKEYPDKDITVDDVLRYVDTKESKLNPLSLSETFQVKSFMKANGIESLSELSQIMNMIFKPDGVIDVNEQFAIESGLYTENDLNEVDLDQVSEIIQKIDSHLLKEDFTVSPNPSQFFSKDTERKTIFGTSERASMEEINRALYPLIAETTTAQDLVELARELPYQELSEMIQEDSEFAENLLELTQDVTRIPKLTFDGDTLTDQNLDYYTTLRNVIPLEADSAKAEANLQILLEMDRTAWNNTEDVREVLKSVEQDFSDYNLDLVGLRELANQPATVISLVQSAVDMLENPTDTNLRIFSELKESVLPTEEVTRLEELPIEYRGYNIVELYTPKTNSELFEEHGLIKVAENLYHKVDQNTSKSDLYEYIYDQYQEGNIEVPNKFILTQDPKNVINKESVLKDIEKFINQRETGLEVNDQELLSLFQVGFRHQTIDQNTPQENVKKLSAVKTDTEYLKNEFVSDFYNYILTEKLNNSEIYRETLSNFEINDKDIVLRSTIESLDDIEMKQELQDYIRISKDSTMDYLLDEYFSTVNEPLVAINYPQQIKEYTNDLFIQGQYMITPTNSADFLRADGKIYRKSLENNDSSLYIEFTPSTDTVYLDNNTNFEFDKKEAQNFLDNFGIPPKSVTHEQVNQQLEDAKFSNEFINKVRKQVTAWHGSPNTFDRFTTENQTEVQANQSPKEVTEAVIDRLKRTGLANEVYTMTSTEIEAKLEEIGLPEEVRKQVIAWHGTQDSMKDVTKSDFKNEVKYGELLSGTYFGNQTIAAGFAGVFEESTLFKAKIDESDFEVIDMQGETPSDEGSLIPIIGNQRYNELVEAKKKGEIKGLILENTYEDNYPVGTSTQYVVFDNNTVEVLDKYVGERLDDLTTDIFLKFNPEVAQEFDIDFQKTFKVTPNGFVYNNEVYLNTDSANMLNTSIHEFGHLWNSWAKQNKPEVYQRGIELIQAEGQEYIDFVRRNQPNLTGEKLYEEALTQAIGDKGEMIVNESRKQSIKDWLSSLWTTIKRSLGITEYSTEELQNLNLEEFATATATELLKGETIVGENIILKYNEKGQHLAPNGKPSNLTENQAKLVRTKEFKSWFGDWENNPKSSSKVVDENGEPLVVYHGSPSVNIEEFNRGKSERSSSGLKEFGTYFTTNKNIAERYRKNLSQKKRDEIDQEIYELTLDQYETRTNRDFDLIDEKIKALQESKKGRVYPVFLNLKEVKEFDAENNSGLAAWDKLRVKSSYKTAQNRDAMDFLKNGKFGVEKVDGIIARNAITLYLGGPVTQEFIDKYLGDAFLVFDGVSGAVKLADGTNTTFNTETDNIKLQINTQQVQENITNTSSILNNGIKMLDLYELSEEPTINKKIDECGG